MTRTIPGHVDSTGKLLDRLSLVAKRPIVQNGKVLRDPPEKVAVSPSIMRRFSCVSGCTACCLPFTLDYTPDEFNTFAWTDEIVDQAVDQFKSRFIEVNGKYHEVVTYEQFRDPKCPYLRPTRGTCPHCEGAGNIEGTEKSFGGPELEECPTCAGYGQALGCGFWTQSNSTQPLECAAAPQVLMTTRGMGTTLIMKRPFGRGWAWKDKPQCEFDPVLDKVAKIPDDFDLSNEIMLMERYLHWANHLGVETHLPAIIEVLQDYPRRLRASNLASVVVYEM